MLYHIYSYYVISQVGLYGGGRSTQTQEPIFRSLRFSVCAQSEKKTAANWNSAAEQFRCYFRLNNGNYYAEFHEFLFSDFLI